MDFSMKWIFRILTAIILLVGLEKLIRTQTRGFRIQKIASEYPFNPDWETGCSAVPEKLNQTFYFLGSGAQTYSFIGEDQTTVLKLFKHYHFWPTSKALRKFPLPSWASSWKQSILNKREKRVMNMFSSAVLAHRHLPEETQILHLNINSKQNLYPTIVIFDNIGIRYSVDLNTTPFVLQKRGQLIYTYLEKHPECTKEVIDSFFSCIRKQASKRIGNCDPHVGRNFGVCESKVIEIDIGSFFIKGSNDFTNSLHEAEEFREWIIKNRPEYEEYFNQRALSA